MKRQWNILNRLSGDNRGSGIVVVLVSMTCIALMGASLLFMSYTAVRMRATERQASHDFYTAETAMDEIRANAQSIAANALGKAYKTILLTYSEGGQVDEDFTNEYVAELGRSGLLTGNKYELSVLTKHVSVPSSGSLKVYSFVEDGPDAGTDPDKSEVNGIVNRSSNTIILKDVYVEYTAANGYTTTIRTDISFGKPDFSYTGSGNLLVGLPEHAFIADGALQQVGSQTSISVNGSAYVGSMKLDTSGSQLTITDGTLVCANEAVVKGYTPGGRLVTKPDTGEGGTGNILKFWAGRIKADDGGNLNLDGETRVLDDLELSGGDASAKLSGSYYGFGNGTLPDDASKEEKQNPNAANYSSAIIVNGLDCTLDFSGLNDLILAGHSYISDSMYPNAPIVANGIGMLESIAVRSNQQMYLLDPAEFEVKVKSNGDFQFVDQNPFIISESDASNLLDKDASGYTRIHLTEDAQKRAEQYGYKLVARQYPYYGGMQIVYCFMEFDTVNAANTYFEEQFAKNKGQLDSYLTDDNVTLYANTGKSNLNVSNNGSASTYGYALVGNDGVYTLSQPTRTQFNPKGMRDTFTQMRTTLIDNAAVDYYDEDDKKLTPYKYIVNANKIGEMTNTETDVAGNEVKKFHKPDGTTNPPLVGIVVKGNYTINSATPASLRLVIATGNVTVSKSYTGLIISGGNIILNTNNVHIEHAATEVNAAIEHGIAGDNDRLINYLLHGFHAEGDDPEEAGSTNGWNLDKLVVYKNWTKN